MTTMASAVAAATAAAEPWVVATSGVGASGTGAGGVSRPDGSRWTVMRPS
jgi:hypothetical protein